MLYTFLIRSEEKCVTKSKIINVFKSINLTYIVKSVNFWLNV